VCPSSRDAALVPGEKLKNLWFGPTKLKKTLLAVRER
jgi:hypothetical protein